MIGCQPQFNVVATAVNGTAVLACLQELVADISLIDMAMLYSIGAVRAIAEAVPRLKSSLSQCPRRTLTSWPARRRVSPICFRDGSLGDLIETQASVGRGTTTCSARIAGSLFSRVGGRNGEAMSTDESDSSEVRSVGSGGRRRECLRDGPGLLT